MFSEDHFILLDPCMPHFYFSHFQNLSLFVNLFMLNSTQDFMFVLDGIEEHEHNDIL